MPLSWRRHGCRALEKDQDQSLECMADRSPNVSVGLSINARVDHFEIVDSKLSLKIVAGARVSRSATFTMTPSMVQALCRCHAHLEILIWVFFVSTKMVFLEKDQGSRGF